MVCAGEDYDREEIRVIRSVWEGFVNETKTRKSKAPVPVITPLRKMLDIFRMHAGNPTTGTMFATMNGTPLSLNNRYGDFTIV